MLRKFFLLSGIVLTAVLLGVAVVTAQGPQPPTPQAAAGTAFTYQGQLRQNNTPVNGNVSVTFKLYSTATGGAPLGSAPKSLNLVNGLFTTQLDFGNVFDGSERWLGISIGSDPEMTPRQQLTAAPYALYASGNWALGGNGGTSPATNFIGTTDNQPLVFKTNNVEAMRLDGTGKLSVVGNADFRGKVGIGVTNPVQLLHMNVITGDREGIEVDSPIAGHAPAIYLNHTGAGGRNYRIASFGDNTTPGSFRIRDETAGTDRVTIDSTGRTSVNGVLSLYDNGRTFNAGVATEVNAQLIDIGINDDSGNRFGGSYISAAPGGFLRIDARGGNLFQFLARSAASTSPVAEVMGITSGGNVGIGVPNPSFRLQLPNNADATGQGQANAWQTYSSRRFKSNVTTIENALDKVQQLRGVTFNWNSNGKHDVGLIAEEVGAVIPEIVQYEANGVDAQSLDYSRLVAVLIEATKQQQTEIAQQRDSLAKLQSEQDSQLAELKQQNAALEARLSALEQRVEAQGVTSAQHADLLGGTPFSTLLLLGVIGILVIRRRSA